MNKKLIIIVVALIIVLAVYIQFFNTKLCLTDSNCKAYTSCCDKRGECRTQYKSIKCQMRCDDSMRAEQPECGCVNFVCSEVGGTV